jgi:multidrug efflux pump subunit AcrA (membrane-fusion protein)
MAPALLLGIAAGLGPLWWEYRTPAVATVSPWRDAGGALLVPAASVRAAGAGEAVVFVIEDGVARARRVRLGSVGPAVVEIREGLGERAVIAADPPAELEDRHRMAGR